MALKLLYKKKWSQGRLGRFEDCRRRSSSSRVDEFREAGRTNSRLNTEFLVCNGVKMHGREIELPSVFGFAVNAPCRAGSTRGFGNSSILMAMYRKPWRNITGNLDQFKALATLTGNRSLDRTKKRINIPQQSPIVKALREGDRTRASDMLQKLGRMKHSLRANDFTDILRYCAKSSDPVFAMETWRLIDERKVRLNSYFCMLMVQALCEGGYLEEAFNLLQYLGENRNVYPILHVYNYFLGNAVKRKNVVYAGKCLDLMERRLVGKSEPTYFALLKLAVLQKNKAAVHELWKDYIKHYPANISLLGYFVVSFKELGDLKSAYEILQFLVACAVPIAAFGVKTINGRSRLDIPIPLKNELSFKKWDSKEISNYDEELDGLGSGMGTTSIFRRNIARESVYPIVRVLEDTFNTLLQACAQTRNCSLAEQLVQQMENLGLKRSQRTYDGLLRAVVYEKGFADGMKVLERMQKRNLEPRKSTLATLSKGCSRALELDMAEALLDQLSECPYPYPYNALLKACKTVDELERAVRVFAKMKKAESKPDIVTYELLFSLFGNVNPPYEKGNMFSQAVVAARIKAIEADMAKNNVLHSSTSIRNLLRALGQEGMIKELIRYLRMAEDLFSRYNLQLGTPVYNTVLFALTAAKESNGAIEIFKTMRRCGFPLDNITYNTMISCCCNIGSFRSATAVVSMMIRDGFLPQTLTYTALLKIVLDDNNFDEALDLLDRASSEGDELDVLLFNTVLKKVGDTRKLDLLEYVIEQIRRANIGPDPSTCSYVFTAYTDREFNRMAAEALHVLSVRIITQEGVLPAEKRAEYEDFIFSEDPEAESRIVHLFEDYRDNIAFALMNLRWCAILGLIDSINWAPDQSPWARRISANYEDMMQSPWR
ncbi:pentatricopeptide repeat-containing protein At1g76280 isoform X1 [Punica granatum]|uniref:Pentatricopeptide repeat-containing protein At1g76280 isoform X1 n=1 Tax=Punica granatum TaxID=22663 RepID=A0A6P8EE47_PUNGR|nr:pentatricopeptide repeat-containing protein At1g76280 isoform X1 [Punica granatum]